MRSAKSSPTSHMFALVLAFFYLIQPKIATSVSVMKGKQKNCTRIAASPITKPAYIGWPVSLQCENLSDAAYNFLENHIVEYDTDYMDESVSFQTQCNIWDLNKKTLVFNESFDLMSDRRIPFHQMPDLLLNSSMIYEITLTIKKLDYCLSTIIHIQPTSLPNLTCEQAMRQTITTSREATLGMPAIFTCEVPDSSYPKMNSDQHPRTAFRWLHNCKEVSSKSSSSPKTLHINKATYDHSGVYTCAVEHNNQIWYTNHYSLCVKPPVRSFHHSVVCTSERVFATRGQNAVFRCKGHIPNIIAGLHSKYSSKWVKGNTTVCRNPAYLLRKKRTNLSTPNQSSQYSCVLNLKKTPCFHQPPSEEDLRELGTGSMDISLTIENVTEADLGMYQVTIDDVFNHEIATAQVILEFNHTHTLMRSSIGIGAAIGVVLSVFLLFPLVLSYRRKKKRAMKRRASIEETTTISESV